MSEERRPEPTTVTRSRDGHVSSSDLGHDAAGPPPIPARRPAFPPAPPAVQARRPAFKPAAPTLPAAAKPPPPRNAPEQVAPTGGFPHNYMRVGGSSWMVYPPLYHPLMYPYGRYVRPTYKPRYQYAAISLAAQPRRPYWADRYKYGGATRGYKWNSIKNTRHGGYAERPAALRPGLNVKLVDKADRNANEVVVVTNEKTVNVIRGQNVHRSSPQEAGRSGVKQTGGTGGDIDSICSRLGPGMQLHPTDSCFLYVMCAHHKGHVKHCDMGLVFDPANMVCQWPMLVPSRQSCGKK